MWKLAVFGIILHILFLGSIFSIYFQSPIIIGLTPQKSLENPPAKRLVLYIVDGLRAESFFRDNCNRTAFLADTAIHKGTIGISHTRVPTETRPGHVALIAGFYEDPSAITKGWQENPLDFDTVFNRSETTYAWGSPDVLNLFTRKTKPDPSKPDAVHSAYIAHTYDKLFQDFSGKDTTAVDRWVFDNTEQFIHRYHENLFEKDRIIFFLHLLGLDTAGHVHKPNSELFDDNLLVVDDGISRITKLMEEVFPDGKTAYLFTSDHGMTDRGSHGAGESYETETPFLAWGAGVSKWTELQKHPANNYEIKDTNVPLYDVNQADITPLISSLIGIPVPMNSFGRLPKVYMNTTEKYRAEALFGNALQLSEQYKFLLSQFKKAMFTKTLNPDCMSFDDIAAYESQIKHAIALEEFFKAEALCESYMEKSLNGIDYFQSYYQKWLLFSTSVAMIGWIMYLTTKIFFDSENNWGTDKLNRSHYLLLVASLLFMVLLIYAQNIPFGIGFYLILPVLSWTPILNQSLIKIYCFAKSNMISFIIYMIATELLVLSFYNRSVLSCLLLAVIIYKAVVMRVLSRFSKTRTLKWILSGVILAVFPILPTVTSNSTDNKILLISLLCWLVMDAYSVYRAKDPIRVLRLMLLLLAVGHISLVVRSVQRQEGLPWISQVFSWLLLGITLLQFLFTDITIKCRLVGLVSSLRIPYILMSLSYEPAFFLVYVMHLIHWIEMEAVHSEYHEIHGLNLLSFKTVLSFKRKMSSTVFINGFLFILYLFLSFFGTGNIASMSSFDPNWTRCFIAKFSPFTMTGLILWKLFTPTLFLICVLRALHIILAVPLEKLFIMILVTCDIMCLNFLFMVKNTGSWLDIGMSISHFVICEAVCLVLLVIYSLTKFLTTAKMNHKHLYFLKQQ